MATYQSLVERALQKLLCEETIGNFSATQLSDGLALLQDMLDSWSRERLKSYKTTFSTFDTANATASYVIGTGQTWNTSQPIDIEAALIRVSNEDYAVDVIRRREWLLIPKKTSSGRPKKLYFEPGDTNGTVYLWPVPTAIEAIYLDMRKQLASGIALGGTAAFPYGYQRAIVFNLAIELADDYGMDLAEDTKRIAAQSLAAIMYVNSPIDMTGLNQNEPQDRGRVMDQERG